MSIFNWLFRRKKPPQIYLGDVQMYLDWNIISSFCHHFGAPVQTQPDPGTLRSYFAQALDLPLYENCLETAAGDQLLHLAITDLRYGFHAALNANDTFIPILFRPSVTFYGYLLDVDSGQVLAEKRVTRKASWLQSANPVLFAWSFFTGEFGEAPSKPMTDIAAQKALRDLKKMAAHTAQTGHLLAKNRIT